MSLIRIARRLEREVDELSFELPVAHVYNPLGYAREPHEKYLKRFGRPGCQALLLGMNPGPFGMAQTGVPFGEVDLVRNFLGIQGRVGKPAQEHPKRPIQGFDCTRSEVSGRRLWGWAQERFGTADAFAETFFVWDFCPLIFLEQGGRNRTPDKLPLAERTALFERCGRALVSVVKHLQPRWVIGIGRFAEDRARDALGAAGLVDGGGGADAAQLAVRIGRILHPSPASPMANRGWSPQAEAQLREMGLDLG